MRDEHAGQVEAFPNLLGPQGGQTSPVRPPSKLADVGTTPEDYRVRDIARTQQIMATAGDGTRQPIGFLVDFTDGARWQKLHGNWDRVWGPSR